MSNSETQNLQIRMMTNEKRHNRMVTVKNETIKKSCVRLKSNHQSQTVSKGIRGCLSAP